MSVVREKIFTKLSSGQIWTDAYWRMPVFIHSCFWKNESLNLRHTHTVFSDYKHQLSINSSFCLQELKQWRHSRVDSYRGKIIVMAKVSLQARAKLLLLRAIICLSSSFWRHPASKLSECTNARLKLMLWTMSSRLPTRAALFVWRKIGRVSRDLG